MKTNLAKLIFIGALTGVGGIGINAIAEHESHSINGSITIQGNDAQKMAQLSKVSVGDAAKVASQAVPGKVLSTLLENEDGFLVYSVKIKTSDQTLKEVLIDAGTGGILVSSDEDDDAE